MNAWAVLLALCVMLTPRSEYIVVGAVPGLPTPLHLAVISMVERCVGRQVPRGTVWVRAEMIVDDRDGTRPYGLTGITSGGTAIVIERAYWLHPGVISHEVIHAILGVTDSEESPEMRRCVMWVGTGLPLRDPLPLDSVAVLRRGINPRERIGS